MDNKNSVLSGLTRAATARVSPGRGPREDDELIDIDEACRLLNVHRNTIYRLIQTDGLPALRLTRGGRWKFSRRTLLDWVEGRILRRAV